MKERDFVKEYVLRNIDNGNLEGPHLFVFRKEETIWMKICWILTHNILTGWW